MCTRSYDKRNVVEIRLFTSHTVVRVDQNDIVINDNSGQRNDAYSSQNSTKRRSRDRKTDMISALIMKSMD